MSKHILRFIVICVVGSGIAAQASCSGPGPVGPVINAVIDCLGDKRSQIDQLLNEFRPILNGGTISWTDVKLRATQAGKDVGGCFIMELGQLFLSGTRASPDAAKEAHAAIESFRRDVAGGATYSTVCVREDGTKQACKL